MLVEKFIKTAKENFGHTILMDSTGVSLTYGQTLAGSILLSNHVRGFAGDNIAVLFPASVGGALAHIAVALAGKVPVGLNFIAGKAEQEHVLDMCEVKTIFTSRTFIEKAGISEDARMVYIEDIREKITKIQKSLMFFSCKLRSKQSLINEFVVNDTPDKIAVIIFTSGSEANPKGVPLTNKNVFSGLEKFGSVFSPKNEIALGTLPFFHVFGFVVCLWMPLISGMGVVYHPNPTDYERIGKIVSKHRVTMLLATSTLFRGFLRRWKREQVSSVRVAFAGAEKLNEKVRTKFYEKFGVTIFEAYGTTESSAAVSVNYPDDCRHGSVGKILPGIDCKIVDLESYDELPLGSEGLILLKGDNFMPGYYKAENSSKNVFHNDYYITGDIGKLVDGFLYITDRLKRFAKIGGEMVPLLPVENKLTTILDEKDSDDERRKCAVVSVPHPQKGEQLAGFVVNTDMEKLELNSSLDKLGVVKLSQPDHYFQIEEIPMLPSGKVDYKNLKSMAIDRLS